MDLHAYQELTWQQFGAAINGLRASIKACPDDLWGETDDWSAFWYNASHALFWLDLYLEPEFTEQFRPPEPFGMEELDPAGKLPPRVYSKEELLKYLEHNYTKCKKSIFSLTDQSARDRFKIGRVDLPRAELMLYSMRHIQHHTAQLNLLIRQHGAQPPGWSFRAEDYTASS